MSAFDDCGECGTEACASFPSACDGVSESGWWEDLRESAECEDGGRLCRWCSKSKELRDGLRDGIDESGVTLFSDLPLWVYPVWTLRWPVLLGGGIVRRLNRRVNPYFELVMGVK